MSFENVFHWFSDFKSVSVLFQLSYFCQRQKSLLLARQKKLFKYLKITIMPSLKSSLSRLNIHFLIWHCTCSWFCFMLQLYCFWPKATMVQLISPLEWTFTNYHFIVFRKYVFYIWFQTQKNKKTFYCFIVLFSTWKGS